MEGNLIASSTLILVPAISKWPVLWYQSLHCCYGKRVSWHSHKKVSAPPYWEVASACLLLSRLWSLWLWHSDHLSIWFYAIGPWCKVLASASSAVAWSFSFGFWKIQTSTAVSPSTISWRGLMQYSERVIHFSNLSLKSKHIVRQEENWSHVVKMLLAKRSARVEVGTRLDASKRSEIWNWSPLCAFTFLFGRDVHTI